MADWPISRRKNSRFSLRPIAFGESGAKQSQGEKPCNAARFSRTASVDYSLRSHPSLRSRQGMKASLARPLLARLPSPRPSPLGLSGSGVRFDGTHLVARLWEFPYTSAPDVDQPAKAGRSLAHSAMARNLAIADRSRNGRDNADWLGSRERRWRSQSPSLTIHPTTGAH